MVSRFKDSLAQQFRLPRKSLMGWITLQMLKYKNSVLEKNAAQLCNIQPHHKVLEIGFGPGIGIQHATKFVKDGPGKICGIELSTYMLDVATAGLRNPIHQKKVDLCFGDVSEIPFATDYFDRIFHCNAFYFWPSMQEALGEIYRVMKPGAFMVTTLNLDSLRITKARGLMKYGHPDPVKYMCALEASGFENVKMEYLADDGVNFQAIFAHITEKPALHEEELEREIQTVVKATDNLIPS